MNNLRRLGKNISVPIEPDELGYVGRECPQAGCEGYFKIEFGTGLTGEGLPCVCPYCGHSAAHDHFWTQAQIEYAKSIAIKSITNAVFKDFKKLEFDHRSRGAFGISMSLKLERGKQMPIQYYGEKKLETDVICADCTLNYSVYGVFAYCPDCGKHNSLQILMKSLDVIDKMLNLASSTEKAVADKLIENCLEDCVSAFDGFGRQLCEVHVQKLADLSGMKRLSFQNIQSASRFVIKHFGVDISTLLKAEEWAFLVRVFQKRHLVAHKMAIVDEEYITKSNDPTATIGRKITINEAEVRLMVEYIRNLASEFHRSLTVSPSPHK
ncbi:hypothetical protein JYU19_01360 [bacterium AH-315-J21]|nr:hypothetical protein [bacterium AH-315-J21]